jgi:hypothetical protein
MDLCSSSRVEVCQCAAAAMLLEHGGRSQAEHSSIAQGETLQEQRAHLVLLLPLSLAHQVLPGQRPRQDARRPEQRVRPNRRAVHQHRAPPLHPLYRYRLP